jgi:uncharacterized protein (TIGR00369 family)
MQMVKAEQVTVRAGEPSFATHALGKLAGLESLQRLADRPYPAPPFAVETDICIDEVEHGRVVFAAIPSNRFYNPLGTMHGGWLWSLLESAMGCAEHSVLAPGQTYTTVDMSVSFVRPVFEKTGKLKCEGGIVHAGARIATAEVTYGTRRARSLRMASRHAW